MRKNNKGITLIALVITIIVIIILAGISINLIFGEKGIIQRAKDQQEMQTKAEILQELELQKGQVMIDGQGYTKLEKYIEYLQNTLNYQLNGHKITKISDEIIEDEKGRYAEIEVDGKYYYTAAQIDNNVVINEIGNIEKLKPEILSVKVPETTTYNMTVEVEAKVVQKYKFYIKKSTESEYTLAEEIDGQNNYSKETVTYVYQDIEQGSTYDIKVVAENGNGSAEEKTNKKLDDISVPIITVSDSGTWTKEKTITISTDSKYTTKYTLDRTPPTASNGIVYTGEFTIDENCTITAVYLDKANQIGAADVNIIEKIDNTPPSAIIQIDETVITSDTTVTIEPFIIQNDSESGVKTSSCKWVYNEKSTDIGTDESKYTGGTLNAESRGVTLETTKTGIYYLHVLTVDNAGNAKETISDAVDIHVHDETCYSTDCKGSFELTNTTETYATCSHTHTAGTTLYSGTNLADNASYRKAGGCYNSLQSVACSGVYNGINATICELRSSDEGSFGYCQYCHSSTASIMWPRRFTLQCNVCGNTFDIHACGIVSSQGIHLGTYHDECAASVVNDYLKSYTCPSKINTYSRSCGKSTGTSNYTRTVQTYKCNECNATTTYKPAANSGTCTRCGLTHNVAASGSTSTTHNAISKYLICDR